MNLLDLAQTLQMAIKALMMYTEAHPRSQEALGALTAEVEAWLREKSSLHLATSGGKLFVDGTPTEGQSLHLQALVRQLSERQIAGFVIQRGVPPEELLAMLKILILKPAKLEEMGGVGKVLSDQRLRFITLSQTQYKEVRQGEASGDDSQAPGEALQSIAAQLETAAPLLTSVSEMLKRWQEGLGAGLPSTFATGSGLAGETSLPPDLAFLGPVAQEMGWGNGFPTAPQIEALRQALKALPGQTTLALLANLDSLPPTPPSLGMAFQSLAPELLGHAASDLLGSGTPWESVRESLFDLLRTSPQQEAMLGTLAGSLQGVNLGAGQFKELLDQLNWDHQSLDEKVRRAIADEGFWNLNADQRNALLRELLELNRPEQFLQLLEMILEQLHSENTSRREGAARALAALCQRFSDPGIPLEAQGPLIQGLVAHFGWEPLAAIHRHAEEALGQVLAFLVFQGEVAQILGILRDLEGLCALLDDNQAWRDQSLARLRERLGAPGLMAATLERYHAGAAEEMLTTVIPYFEYLGEPAARYLVNVLGEEPDRRRRGRLLDIIRVMGSIAIPALQEGLRSSTWYFVRNTLNLLADMGDAGLLEDVALCLRHPDARVRRSAVRALWKLGGPAAGQPLLACMPGNDPDTQMEILFGLGQIQATQAVPPVLDLARNSSAPERIRIKAIETLGQVASPTALPGLVELLRRKGRIFTSAEPTEIRLAAARALLAIGTPQAELALQQVVADEPRTQDRDALQRILDLHRA